MDAYKIIDLLQIAWADHKFMEIDENTINKFKPIFKDLTYDEAREALDYMNRHRVSSSPATTGDFIQFISEWKKERTRTALRDKKKVEKPKDLKVVNQVIANTKESPAWRALFGNK